MPQVVSIPSLDVLAAGSLKPNMNFINRMANPFHSSTRTYGLTENASSSRYVRYHSRFESNCELREPLGSK